MKIFKLSAAVLSAAFVIVGITLIMPAESKPQPASAAAEFDHSNCQYPDRWTNPLNSCDNSDPAVPECIKAFSTQQGEADCIAAFVAEHNSNPVITPETNNNPVTTPAPEKASQCGGK